MKQPDLLAEISHRPWPIPTGKWIWSQRWSELLFTHWRISTDLLRPLVPVNLQIDLLDGEAWVSAVTFWMENVRPRGLPSLPVVSTFTELNVRTYVVSNGKAGVYFLSIDAGKHLASYLARTISGLPYRYASLKISKTHDSYHARCQRLNQTTPCFEAQYTPSGPTFVAQRGSAEHWLSERYCLFTLHKDRLYEAQIHHGPWPLRERLTKHIFQAT